MRKSRYADKLIDLIENTLLSMGVSPDFTIYNLLEEEDEFAICLVHDNTGRKVVFDLDNLYEQRQEEDVQISDQYEVSIRDEVVTFVERWRDYERDEDDLDEEESEDEEDEYGEYDEEDEDEDEEYDDEDEEEDDLDDEEEEDLDSEMTMNSQNRTEDFENVIAPRRFNPTTSSQARTASMVTENSGFASFPEDFEGVVLLPASHPLVNTEVNEDWGLACITPSYRGPLRSPYARLLDDFQNDSSFQIDRSSDMSYVVLTAADHKYGARYVASPKAMDAVAEKLHARDVLVIPCSIHEVICMKLDQSEYTAEALDQKIRTINYTLPSNEVLGCRAMVCHIDKTFNRWETFAEYEEELQQEADREDR